MAITSLLLNAERCYLRKMNLQVIAYQTLIIFYFDKMSFKGVKLRLKVVRAVDPFPML